MLQLEKLARIDVPLLVFARLISAGEYVFPGQEQAPIEYQNRVDQQREHAPKLTTMLENSTVGGDNEKDQEGDEFELHDGREDFDSG